MSLAPSLQRALLPALPRLLSLPGPLLRRLAGAPRRIRGRELDPAFALLERLARTQAGPAGQTPERVRATANAGIRLLAGSAPAGIAIEALEVPGGSGPRPARIYRPRSLEEPSPLLLYFHQGGFVIGNLDWCEAFCGMLAEVARCRVLSVAYRLAPEHPLPAAHEDAWASFSWARQEAARFGGDPTRLAVGGESAGGNLAAWLAQESLRRGEAPPVFELLVFPWLAGAGRLPSYADFGRSYPLTLALMDWFLVQLGGERVELESPHLNLLARPGLAGLPPTHVATAGFDVLSDEGARYAERLREAGVAATHTCHESVPHSFTAMGALAAAARAQRAVAEALARGLAAVRSG